MVFILIISVVLLLFIIYECYENQNMETTQYDIQSKDIPKAFDGLKMVVIADLHNNTFGKGNTKLIKEINNNKPDFIIIAGDMIVSKEPVDFNVSLALLTKLADQYPIYYGYGNHEQRLLSPSSKESENFNEYKNKLEKLGVIFLENKKIILSSNGDKICITGLMIGKEYFKKLTPDPMTTQYLQKLVGIPYHQCYNILIAHNPMYFREYVNWGGDLILSGHNHGGIVRLPGFGGVISPQYKLFPKYDGGSFEKDGKTMLVSRGLGTHTIKLRMFNRPELMVVTLRSLK